MKRRTFVALVAGGLAAAVPAVAAAVVVLWTLVGSPLTATVNQSTFFTLTATNLDPLTELGCLEVDLPASFVIESLGTPVASNNDPWSSSQSGNAVIVRSLSGGGRLELGETVQFTIRAHATVAGAFLWPNHAHRQQDCSSADQAGVPLEVTVLPALLPTLAPTATPAPTASPTATPILPLPTPILPLPTIDLLPTPRPTPAPVASPTATATPRETATPEPSRSPAGGDGAGGIGSGPSGGRLTSGTASSGITVARGLDEGGAAADVGVELFSLLDADFVWFVPAASVGLPGLLVIAWVLLQAFGAAAWIPAVRRMAEERGRG